MIGGNGARRTLPLVAAYADEWNAVFLRPDELARRSALLDRLLRQRGREPGAVRRTLMTGVQRVMLQWLDLDDLVGLELLADAALGRA